MSHLAGLRRFVEGREFDDAGVLAREFLSSADEDALLVLVEWLIQKAIREHVRSIEVEALSISALQKPWTAARVVSALEEFAPLLDKPYRIGDGVARAFGDLTVDQHRTRILMLQSQINGLQQDVVLHEAAIRVCEQYGAACLHEAAARRQAA